MGFLRVIQPGAHLVLVCTPLVGGRNRDELGFAGSAAGLGKHHRVLRGEHVFCTPGNSLQVLLDVGVRNQGYLFLVVGDAVYRGEVVAAAVLGIGIPAQNAEQQLCLGTAWITGCFIEAAGGLLTDKGNQFSGE